MTAEGAIISDVLQVVDYAIARKIVSLHNNVDDTVERVYTQEEVLRYISFARQFKPIISEVSYLTQILTQQCVFDCPAMSTSCVIVCGYLKEG